MDDPPEINIQAQVKDMIERHMLEANIMSRAVPPPPPLLSLPLPPSSTGGLSPDWVLHSVNALDERSEIPEENSKARRVTLVSVTYVNTLTGETLTVPIVQGDGT